MVPSHSDMCRIITRIAGKLQELNLLQHRDEICSSVNATKVERNDSDGARFNPKHLVRANQQPSPE